MSFTSIAESSAATPGLWNLRFQELDTTISISQSGLSNRLVGYNAGIITSALTATLGITAAGTIQLSASTGTFNLAQGHLLSIRTQPSFSSTNLAVDEIGFSLHGSGASLALRSGGTIWYFTSSASTKG